MIDGLVVVGRVSRPHGVQGEIRVRPYTESVDTFQKYDRLYFKLQGRAARPVEVTGIRPDKADVLLRIRGLETRDEARKLSGAEVLVKREWLPDLEEGEYYWTDLIGLPVFDTRGQCLGTIRNMYSGGGADLMVLDVDGREVWMPFNEEVVTEVDLTVGRLILDPPKGLLDL
jgi:16S rRNA processing protein RimM